MWKILKSPNFFNQRLYYIFSFFFKKFTKNIFSRKTTFTFTVHSSTNTVKTFLATFQILTHFTLQFRRTATLPPLPLSRGFKNHSSKFRENLYSSVSHVPHTHITFSFATNIIATRLRRKYEFIQLSFLVFDTFEAANLH